MLAIIEQKDAQPFAAQRFEPTADEIFGPIFESYEMKDVLYVCDILKNCSLACNITQAGPKKQQGKHQLGWKISHGKLRSRKKRFFLPSFET